ncbi:MAG: hypothetical protein ACRBFS_07340, partial [Aureispira sp.]
YTLSLFLWVGSILQAQGENLSKTYEDSLQMEFLKEEGFENIALTIEQRKTAFEKAETLAIKYGYKKRQFFILGDAGDYYKDIGELEEAIGHYKKAIQLKERAKLVIKRRIYARFHNALSAVLQDWSKEITITDKTNVLEEALLHSKISLKLDARRDNAWLLLGNTHIRLAEHKMDQLEESEFDKTARIIVVKNALEHYEVAAVAYRKVERLRPDHPDIEKNLSILYRNRGKLLGKYLGEIEQSITALETAISYYKKDVETYRLLGIANGIKGMQLQHAGKEEEGEAQHLKAIQYFEKALLLKPESVPTLYNLEVAHRMVGQPEKAAVYHKKSG